MPTRLPEIRPRAPKSGEPEVLLDVELANERFYLVLANVGPAVAFDVSVEFQKPLLGVGGDVVVSEMRLFRHLPMLRPGAELRVFVDTRRELLARRQGKIVVARVVYRSRTERWLGESFRHDLRIWADWGEAH